MKTRNNPHRLSLVCIAVALCLAVDGANGQPSKTPKPPTTQARTIPGKTPDLAKSSNSSSSGSSQTSYKAQGSGGGTVPKAARDQDSAKGSKGSSSQTNNKTKSTITADNLTIVGLSPASAAALAGKAASGDEEAAKTAKLVIKGSGLLQETGATSEQTTAALEEIAK